MQTTVTDHPKTHGRRIPDALPSARAYEIAFAETPEEVDDVLKLRYEVFNLELSEGLASSHATGRDQDEFDAQCDHLVVRERASGRPVGTYRLQTFAMAREGIGLYAETEFDFAPLPTTILRNALEIGRACIARDHRNLEVLYLLWKGLGRYATHNHLRYLFGCCSLTSQDPDEATRVYRRLITSGQMHKQVLLSPLPSHRCLVENPADGSSHVPRLMRAYLTFGAKICSQPAIDREFSTVDYLALFDLSDLGPARRSFFL